jgi:hypothetical protein
MTIFERFWNWLTDLISEIWTTEGPALTAWLKQFSSDEGQVILTDAAIYGPQIYAGTITITDAANKLYADLKAKGITDAGNLLETVFNALRTQTNLAASSAPVAAPALATTITPGAAAG